MSESRISRHKRDLGLRAKAARKLKATTDCRHSKPVTLHILQRNFKAEAPNHKWVGDITYIRTDEGWLYLAVVIDLYNRMVVGWSLHSRMTASLVCSDLSMAVSRRGAVAKTLCHFDRGSQYASDILQALFKCHGFTCSMSRIVNCWDNSVAESFFHSLKVEAIHDEKFQTRNQAKVAVFDWIECFYDRTRRHSALGYMAPHAFERMSV